MSAPRLRKALGQHHLRHAGLLDPLLDFLRPAGRRVVEIGPGGGVLTRRLIEGGARVWGIELDPHWAGELRRRLPAPELALVVADAVELGWERLPPGTLVTGNLPYNVATPLVTAVVRQTGRVARAAFLVQREVAERMTSPAGRRSYGSLSVLVAAYTEARILGRVPPGAFRPPPKVDSSFVGFTLRPPPLPPGEMAALEGLVRLGFAQKRKTLRNALAAGWGRERAGAVLGAAGLPPLTRAEELPLADWLRLYQAAREVENAKIHRS